MKNCFYISLLIVANFGLTQPTSFIGRQSYSIYNLAKTYHYNPAELNDTFSSTVFYSFIKAIDGGGYFFLNSDIERFQKHQYNIDDQIKARTSTFFDEVAQVYKLRLTSADSILDVLEKETFNFKQKEVLSYHPDHYPDNVNTVIELKERWRKWIQYSILEELFNGDYFDSAIGESTESLMSKIHLAEEEVFAYEHFAIEVYLKNPSGYETKLSTFYLDAIATTYDPHTSYFSGVQKEEFIEELSEEKKMFGFSVEEDDKGIIRIYDLVPGSAAWNSNQLNKGDEILSVTLGDGKSIDMQTSKVSDLMLLMSSSKSEELTLEIKKGNGEVLEVELKKSEVYIAEDAIQNAILNGDKKIGYITLPDFYTNWDDDGGLGCANDVARTIVKIQKENISGLILDLRNNGGGSLLEAIDLAGIFIDWGPLAIVHDKNGEATSIKDMNKGAIYTGPLVILVNGLSASASEIITAALQDYNRAIVIGSPTYGKATSQIILPLDPDFIYGVSDINKSDESFGHLKITIGGFYRITNSSHQRSGIIPDIIMPDFYDIYDYKESSYPNAIVLDSILKKVYFTPFNKFPSQLTDLSHMRLRKQTNIIELTSIIDSLVTVQEEYETLPLNLEDYLAYEKNYTQLIYHMFDLEINSNGPFLATNNQFDQSVIDMNAYRREMNIEFLENIKTDIYIQEAYSVLCDYINLKQ